MSGITAGEKKRYVGTQVISGSPLGKLFLHGWSVPPLSLFSAFSFRQNLAVHHSMAECISSLCSDDAISEEQLSTPGRGLNLTEFELAVRKVDRQKLRRTVSFSNKPSEIFVIDNVPEPFRVDCHSGEGLLHHLEATYEVVTLLCFAGQLMKER